MSHSVDDFLQRYIIIHETFCSYTLSQNRVAECKNRQLLKVTHSLLFQKNIPKHLWGAVVLTSAYLTNHILSRTLRGHTLVSLLTPNQKPYSPPPRVFGCFCFVRSHAIDVKKLDPRSIHMVFLGYSHTQKGYKCLDHSTGRWYVSRDATFIEYESYFPYPFPQGNKIVVLRSISKNNKSNL